MSEPITLTERERAVFGSMIEYVRERCRNNARDGNQASGNAVSRWMEDWLASQPTESASPPRVPGASAQLAREGVQSGPGQPTDALGIITQAMLAVEAMGADPRLTDAVLFLQHAQMRVTHFANDAHREPLNVVISAAELARLRADAASHYRAGIEAAAKLEDTIAKQWLALPDQRSTLTYHELALSAQDRAKRIRALADKPAPDAARGRLT